MALPCSRRLLPTIVAQILQQLGWDAVHQSVMDVLVDILDRNLTSICRKVHFFSELDGRTVPDLDDLDMAFRDLGVNLHDLLEYVTEVEPSSLVIDVPQFPISAEKIRSRLNGEKNSATNKVKMKKQTEEQRLETEDGSQGAAPIGATSATTPGTSAADVKPFANESGTNKRPRLLPDEAMHSQYEMKSFLMSNSGCFIPVKPGIRASARCGSPPAPKRPVQRSPALPVYTFEAADVIGNLESGTSAPEVRMLHMKHVKKSGKLAKDGLHKLLKHGVKKPKKISHVGPSGMSKLPKSLKLEKSRLNKLNSSDKKSSGGHFSAPQTYPLDPTQVCEDAPVDRELQKSRIRSYEDSINTVVQYSSQDGVNFSPDGLHVLPSVAGPSVLDGRASPVDEFYLDLGSPPPPTSQLFDRHSATERDAHINSTIDDVIKASSLDDNLKISPEPRETENETEPKQSAVEDIFDISSVPSPKILTTWQTVEEEVIEEPVVAAIGDFSISNVLGVRDSPAKKSKKLKVKTPYKGGFDESSKKSESQNKKASRHPAEQLVFDDSSSLGSWPGEEDRERKSKDPLGLSTVLPEASVFPKNVDGWNKKSKRQTSEPLNVDSVFGLGRSNDKFERNFAQFTPVSDVPQLPVGTDDANKKRKHRHGNEDATTPSNAERKKSKHASNRSAFGSTLEPQRAARDRSDEVYTGPQDNKQSLICEWPKVRLENVGLFDEKKPSKKRPFPRSPTPPSYRQSPEPHSFSSKSLLPPSPPPLPLVCDHLDTSNLPPLKRIKIVSSAGVVNQFEIKDPPQSSSVVEKDYKPDRKEKKKAKKSKDRERSRDRKDRNSNYEPRDHTPTTYSRDWESPFSSKMDSKPGKISTGGDKHHHHRAMVQSPGEDLSWRSSEDQFGISRAPTGQTQDYRFPETSANSVEHRWKGDTRTPKEEDVDRERSRSHKKKDRSKSRDEGKSERKEDRRKEQGEKPVEKSEHKKKKSDRKRESELSSETVPPPLPSIPKLTLKFGGSSTGTPSLSRTGEPSIQPVSRITEQPTNPPIKLRFKTGFSSMPSAVSPPSPAAQLPYYNSTPRPAAKFSIQARVNQSLLEVPTFSPSPESISIPSPNDSSDSELSVGGRERGPMPPSLSVPALVAPLHRVPVYTSSSSASSRSPSPPTLRLPKEVDGWQASFSASSRRSAPLQPVESAVVQAPKSETSSRVLKSSTSSKGSSQKLKSSARVASPPKVFPSHMKGLPPSKIMPPAMPALPLLPAPKASQLGVKSGSSKSKKRVTTETVSKVVNEDGVVTTWICPACLLEDKGEEPMIGCDGCDDWYHWRCVGVIVEPPKEIPWYCQRCQVKSKAPLKTPSGGRGKGKKSKRK